MIKQCVLIGAQGSGKTTLFNKLCQQQEMTQSSMESCTKIITTGPSKDAYLVVDTPGISFCNDIFQHSIPILAALTNGPIHKILLVIEYQYRKDRLEFMISKTITLVREFTQLLGVVITHFDLCNQEDAEKFKIETKKLLKDNYSIDYVLFSGKDTAGEELSFDIQQSLFEKGQVLKISDNLFDLMMLEHKFDKILEQGKQQILKSIKIFQHTVMQFLDEFQETVDQDQILNSLLIFVRKEQNELQNEFIKQYGPIMEKLHTKSKDPILAYYYYYVVKYHIKQMVQELANQINKRMIYSEDHPFRLLRRCPFCDTIWLRVIGCTDTFCGNRLDINDEVQIIFNLPIYNQYEFFYLNKQEIDYKQIELNYEQHQQLQQLQYDQKVMKFYKAQENYQIQLEMSTQCQTSEESEYEQTDTESQTVLDSSFMSRVKVKKVNQKSQTVSPFGKKMKQAFLENQQQEQILKNDQIGCGQRFDWDSAPIVNIDDIDLNQQEIIALFSDKEIMYKQEYKIFKNQQIKKALMNQKNL